MVEAAFVRTQRGQPTGFGGCLVGGHEFPRSTEIWTNAPHQSLPC
jgi:hypothetical protein